MELHFEQCSPKYWEFVRRLRNDLREGFLSQEPITDWEHQQFMTCYHGWYRIALNEKEQPVGFIGSVNGDIRYAVTPEQQGKGIGKWMVLNFIEIFNHPENLTAKVKPDNIASQKVFEACGFEKKFIIYQPKEK